MSDKPNGFGAEHCDVCGGTRSWGCGHSGAQEAEARRHRRTKTHERRECMCFGHDHCDPRVCKMAGQTTSGYMPNDQHTPEPKVKVVYEVVVSPSIGKVYRGDDFSKALRKYDWFVSQMAVNRSDSVTLLRDGESFRERSRSGGGSSSSVARTTRRSSSRRTGTGKSMC